MASSPADGMSPSSVSHELLPSIISSEAVSLQPSLSSKFLKPLLAETVYAVCAIGGHENPPARHIVGSEAVSSVKEKLKTVSEELEDFVECSSAVDIEEKGPGKNEKDTKKEREEKEKEVGASTSQNSLTSGASVSTVEEGNKLDGKRGGVASPVAGRKRSEGSIGGGGKRGSVGNASASNEMDVDEIRDGSPPKGKRKGKGRKKSNAV